MINRHYQTAWVLAGTALLAVLPVFGQTRGTKCPEVSPAEYEVFSAFISKEFTGKAGTDRVGGNISQIVIEDKTQSDHDDEHLTGDDDHPIAPAVLTKYLLREAPTLKRDTIQAFRKAQCPSNLHRAFQLSMDFRLVPSDEIDAIFKNGGWWDSYYKKFPGSQGFMRLSRAGFSADSTQAMFYVANGCGGKCGTGSYVVMEKRNSKWRVVKEIILWIS